MNKISHADELNLDIDDIDFGDLDIDADLGIDKDQPRTESPVFQFQDDGEEPTVQVNLEDEFLSDLDLPSFPKKDDQDIKKSDDVLIRKEYKSSLKGSKDKKEDDGTDPDADKPIHNVFLSQIKDSTHCKTHR